MTSSVFCVYCQFAPFILTPTAFPRREFEKAVGLQTILNELMHWVAHDTEFLRETLASTIRVDDFTAQLFRIYERTLAEGVTQVCEQGSNPSHTLLPHIHTHSLTKHTTKLRSQNHTHTHTHKLQRNERRSQ